MPKYLGRQRLIPKISRLVPESWRRVAGECNVDCIYRDRGLKYRNVSWTSQPCGCAGIKIQWWQPTCSANASWRSSVCIVNRSSLFLYLPWSMISDAPLFLSRSGYPRRPEMGGQLCSTLGPDCLSLTSGYVSALHVDRLFSELPCPPFFDLGCSCMEPMFPWVGSEITRLEGLWLFTHSRTSYLSTCSSNGSSAMELH